MAPEVTVPGLGPLRSSFDPRSTYLGQSWDRHSSAALRWVGGDGRTVTQSSDSGCCVRAKRAGIWLQQQGLGQSALWRWEHGTDRKPRHRVTHRLCYDVLAPAGSPSDSTYNGIGASVAESSPYLRIVDGYDLEEVSSEAQSFRRKDRCGFVEDAAEAWTHASPTVRADVG